MGFRPQALRDKAFMFPGFAFRIAAPVAPGSQHALEQGDEVVIVGGRLLESWLIFHLSFLLECYPHGAPEQHGPHSAMLTDVIIPTEIARRVAP
jgi:hypothetical protein